MFNVFVGPIIEFLVLLLPAFLSFKNRSEFLSCFHSFMFAGNHPNTTKQEKRSVKFATYFVIVLFGSIMNLMLFL
jgi:hypothetical protein